MSRAHFQLPLFVLPLLLNSNLYSSPCQLWPNFAAPPACFAQGSHDCALFLSTASGFPQLAGYSFQPFSCDRSGLAQRSYDCAQVLGTATGFTLPAGQVQPTAFGDAPSPGAEQRPLACFGMLLPLLPGSSLTSLLEQRCARIPV